MFIVGWISKRRKSLHHTWNKKNVCLVYNNMSKLGFRGFRGFKLEFDEQGNIAEMEGSTKDETRFPSYVDPSANIDTLETLIAPLSKVRNGSMFVNADKILKALFETTREKEIEHYENNAAKMEVFQDRLSNATLLVEQPVRREEKLGRNITVYPKFQSLVYLLGPGDFAGKIMKVYLYDTFLSTEAIIKEIAFQQSALELQHTCRVVTPQILDYGFFSNVASLQTHVNIPLVEQLKTHTVKNEHMRILYVFYVIMDNMLDKNLVTLDYYMGHYEPRSEVPGMFHEIATKVHAMSKCLEDHFVFQNDFNTRNVFLDPSSMELGLIDYGKAREREMEKSIPTTVEKYERYLHKAYRHYLQAKEEVGSGKRRHTTTRIRKGRRSSKTLRQKTHTRRRRRPRRPAKK